MKFDKPVLLRALNELPEAVIIYDEQDQFVVCNDANHRLYPHLSRYFREGALLEEILRQAFRLGQWQISETDEAEFIRRRREQHWLAEHAYEQVLDDGRVLSVRNRRLANEIFIGIRQDISASRGQTKTALRELLIPSSLSELCRAHNGKDILVCEDNEVNQIVFAQILERTGYTFHIAANGKEGLALYRHLKPRLILTDVSMPLMNGLDFTMAIRNAEAGKAQSTPIIGITAHAVNGDRKKCMEAGMNDYLPKPISPDLLEAKVKAWMTGSNQALG